MLHLVLNFSKATIFGIDLKNTRVECLTSQKLVKTQHNRPGPQTYSGSAKRTHRKGSKTDRSCLGLNYLSATFTPSMQWMPGDTHYLSYCKEKGVDQFQGGGWPGLGVDIFTTMNIFYDEKTYYLPGKKGLI